MQQECLDRISLLVKLETSLDSRLLRRAKIVEYISIKEIHFIGAKPTIEEWYTILHMFIENYAVSFLC